MLYSKKLCGIGAVVLAAIVGLNTAIHGRAAEEVKAGKAGGIEISIALPETWRHEPVRVDIRRDLHFPVVITNTSDKPINFLMDNNSWGYEALRFDLTDEKGNHYRVEKGPRAWKDNAPAYWILQPGDHAVLEVCFGGEIGGQPGGTPVWTGLPMLQNTLHVTMTAIFDPKNVPPLNGETIWDSRVESKPIDCILNPL